MGTVEQDIASKGLTAPRITLDAIKALVVDKHFINAGAVLPKTAHQKLGCLTICVLVLNNGFIVTGESSCVSLANFDAEIGERIAYENAIEKIWPLAGYALQQKLFEEQQSAGDLYKRLQTLDAEVWAKEFGRLNSAADMDTMRAWFANAIEITRDQLAQKDA